MVLLARPRAVPPRRYARRVIKDRSRRLLETPDSRRDSLDIDVPVSAEVTAIDPAARIVTVRALLTGEQYTEGWDELALCRSTRANSPVLHVLQAGREHMQDRHASAGRGSGCAARQPWGM